MARRSNSTDTAIEELRAFGLTYPGAHTKSPWPGHLDLAVNDKTFAYLSVAGNPFSISCKLPHSAEEALSLPFVTPAAYGLGKSGWVNAQLESGPVPLELFQAWIDESYRAQAPKRLLATLAETSSSPAGPKKRAPARARKRPAATAPQRAAPQRAAAQKRPTLAAKKKPTKPAAKRRSRASG